MGAADEEPMEGSSDGEEKIFVSVRLRPLNEKELARNGVSDWECINDNTIIYRNNLTVSERSMYPTAYTFDRVFRPDCSTRQVYEEGAKKVALSVVSGINSTVFAYGQTSSGKTYTMSGITEYTVSDIYEYIDKHMEREFILKFSAMEIYNESVRDLLSTDETPLRLLDDPERGTVVERLTEETVRDWSHFRELLSICEAQRQIGETNLNEASSRSHQILRLTIESSAHELLGNDKSSSLAATVNFVDLAGSERASQSLSAGMRLKEGCHINRSLLTLGTVIRKLSKGRTGHIPFRDSKLTRILQSSLGGNARTAIICTMSPARIHVEQSRNTLLFASCAKEVTTNAQVNVVVSDKALVKQLQRELARLESELKRPHSVSSDTSEVLREKDIQIEQLTKEVIELTQRLNQAQIQIEDLLQAAADVRHPPPTIEPDHEYPKLRVQNSWMLENSVSYSSISEHIQSINAGIRSSNAPKSQCSDRESTSSSTENSVHLTEFDGQFQQADSSPEPSIKSASSIGNEVNKEDTEDETEENFDTICKEVQCIQVDEPNGKRYETSTMLELSPSRYADSNTSSPKDSKVVSGLTEVDYHYEENEKSVSRPIKEHNGKTDVHSASAFIIPSPEKHSPWTFDETPSYTKLSLMKSRSCRARLMSNSPTCWFEKLQNNDCVPVNISFARRSEVCVNELSTFNYEPDIKNISAKDSETSICSAAPEERTVQAVETPTECKSTTTGKSDAAIILVDDDQVEEPKSEPIVSEKAVKEVKDIGLDPIPDDAEDVPQWPLEFKKLQGEIIELWHACNISLIHRTFFFMLFKGDPSDSFYIEVELKRLLFLKNTFSRGDKTIVNGQILTLKSSKRALDAERQMLRRQIKKRLTREERENLFLKWGISLNSSNRRVQLTSYLWSKTDLDHVTDSATLVAKLIGFEEQEKPLKEIFGLLNFTPKRLSRRKSVFSLL